MADVDGEADEARVIVRKLASLPMPVLLVCGAVTPAIHAEVFRKVCASMPRAGRFEIVCRALRSRS